jgi:hypothetical protein
MNIPFLIVMVYYFVQRNEMLLRSGRLKITPRQGPNKIYCAVKQALGDALMPSA